MSETVQTRKTFGNQLTLSTRRVAKSYRTIHEAIDAAFPKPAPPTVESMLAFNSEHTARLYMAFFARASAVLDTKRIPGAPARMWPLFPDWPTSRNAETVEPRLVPVRVVTGTLRRGEMLGVIAIMAEQTEQEDTLIKERSELWKFARAERGAVPQSVVDEIMIEAMRSKVRARDVLVEFWRLLDVHKVMFGMSKAFSARAREATRGAREEAGA